MLMGKVVEPAETTDMFIGCRSSRPGSGELVGIITTLDLARAITTYGLVSFD